MKKSIKTAALILALTLVVSMFSGCSLLSSGANEKEFSAAGMTITLTDRFTQKNMISQTAYYEATDTIVTVLKEESSIFSDAGLDFSAYTLDDYAALVVSVNEMEADIVEKGGIKCFTYEREVSGNDYAYLATVFKSSDAFWLIQFACFKDDYNDKEDDFVKWAKSVAFE